MERFRLRVRNEPKRGDIWELHLFPDQPHRIFREVDGRSLGSASNPAAILWLRKLASPYLAHSRNPGPMDAESFGPKSEPCWLEHEDGMRLALAFSSARWLYSHHQRMMFREGLYALPSEVVLYWFTLCFYGYRQAAARAALRVLLSYDEATDEPDAGQTRNHRASVAHPELFGEPSPQTLSNRR